MLFSIHTDLIFICIDHVCFLLSDCLNHTEKSIRRRYCLLIRKQYIISHCQFQCCIQILRDSLILCNFLIRKSNLFFIFLS